ncbi:hypothetical protein JW964_27910 [candidate division KSB1 bacterium]|nr:hypothetical protein [candidate division KSB1 bacterium]
MNYRYYFLFILLFLIGCEKSDKHYKIGQQYLPMTESTIVFGHQLGNPAVYQQHFPAPFGLAFYVSLFQDVDVTLNSAEQFRKLEPLLNKLGDTVPLLMLRLTNNQLIKISEGEYTAEIVKLGETLKSYGKPLFLGVGFEVNNLLFELSTDSYAPAYRNFVDLLKKKGVQNVSFIWHIIGMTPRWVDPVPFQRYYPGDEYVNWLGLSIQNIQPHHFPEDGYYANSNDEEIINFAKQHNLPIIICESSTRSVDKNLNLSGDALWNDWYVPFFDFIKKNNIRAMTHIFYSYEDSLILYRWSEKVRGKDFLNASERTQTMVH